MDDVKVVSGVLVTLMIAGMLWMLLNLYARMK
jgi:hypothetical protein